jgi:hypothetical protein
MFKGLLLAVFDFAGAQADESPTGTTWSMCRNGRRFPDSSTWSGDETPTLAIASYDLGSTDVMNTPVYQAVAVESVSIWTKRIAGKTNRLMRFEGRQFRPGDAAAPSGADGLLVASMNIDPGVEAEFAECYDTEHLPQLSAVAGVRSGSRYRAAAAS